MKNDCLGCEKRKLYCHDTCVSYLEFQKAVRVRRSSRKLGYGVKACYMNER